MIPKENYTVFREKNYGLFSGWIRIQEFFLGGWSVPMFSPGSDPDLVNRKPGSTTLVEKDKQVGHPPTHTHTPT